jgi:antitoxin ParD1/3/4
MSRTLTVTLGDLQNDVEKRVQSGAYTSASEVIREGLRALNREEQQYDAWMKSRIQEAMDDPRPSVSADEVFGTLRAPHAAIAGSKRD